MTHPAPITPALADPDAGQNTETPLNRAEEIRGLLAIYGSGPPAATVRLYLEALDCFDDDRFQNIIRHWSMVGTTMPRPGVLFSVGTHLGKLRIKSILRHTATQAEVSLQELLSPIRTRRLAEPRQAAVTRCYEQFEDGKRLFSLPDIGRECGGRDHTTILHAVRTTEHRRLKRCDDWLRPLTEAEIAMLKGVG